MSKIELIQDAISKADKFQSHLSDDALQVPALASLKVRALLNNLGRISIRYGEIGNHKGGTFCSAIFGNDNLLSATAIDSFESDLYNEEQCKPIFLNNVDLFLPKKTEFKLIHSDSFSFDLSEALGPIDFYLYDGQHSEDAQCKALTHFLPMLADEFIFCCDDYSWDDVRNGTKRGLKESGLEVLFEQELITEEQYLNTSWWTGYYVALLKKKK